MPLGGAQSKLWAFVAGAMMAGTVGAQPSVPIVPVQGPGIAPPAQSGQSGFSKAGAAIDRSLSGFSGRMKTLFSTKESIESSEPPSPWINSEKARNPDPELFASFADLQLQQGNLPGAEAQYKKALEKDPKYLPAIAGLAQVYQQMGRSGQAQELYRQAIAANPREASLHNDLAVSYLQEGRAAEAIQEFEKAIAIDPRNQLYRNNIARPLLGLERNADAYSHLSSVYEPAVAFYNMGYLLHEKGDRSGALMHFRKALEIKPDFAEAKQWCASLEGQFQPRSPGMGYQPLLARQPQARPPLAPPQPVQQFAPAAPVEMPMAAPPAATPTNPPAAPYQPAAPSAPAYVPAPLSAYDTVPESYAATVNRSMPAAPSPARTQALPALTASASAESDVPPLVAQQEIALPEPGVTPRARASQVIDLPAAGPEHSPAANPFHATYEELAVAEASPAQGGQERVAEQAKSQPISGVHYFPSHDWTGESAREVTTPQSLPPPLVQQSIATPTAQPQGASATASAADESYWHASGAVLTGEADMSMLTPPSDLALMASEVAEVGETPIEPVAPFVAEGETASTEPLPQQQPVSAATQPSVPERWVLPAPRSAFTIREKLSPPPAHEPAKARDGEAGDDGSSQWRAYRAPSRY